MGNWPENLLEELTTCLGKTGRTMVVLGASGLGKTTLIRDLSASLLGSGRPVFIIGADPGQAAWGPPTCITLVRLPGGAPVAIEFVGSLDPVRNNGVYLTALVRILKRAGRHLAAATGDAIIIVDAPGVIRGWLALRFVESMLCVVDPDLVVLFEAENEDRRGSSAGSTVAGSTGSSGFSSDHGLNGAVEPTSREHEAAPEVRRSSLDWLKSRGDLNLKLVRPASEARRISSGAKRRFRTDALTRYLEGATPLVFIPLRFLAFGTRPKTELPVATVV